MFGYFRSEYTRSSFRPGKIYVDDKTDYRGLRSQERRRWFQKTYRRNPSRRLKRFF